MNKMPKLKQETEGFMRLFFDKGYPHAKIAVCLNNRKLFTVSGKRWTRVYVGQQLRGLGMVREMPEAFKRKKQVSKEPSKEKFITFDNHFEMTLRFTALRLVKTFEPITGEAKNYIQQLILKDIIDQGLN